MFSHSSTGSYGGLCLAGLAEETPRVTTLRKPGPALTALGGTGPHGGHRSCWVTAPQHDVAVSRCPQRSQVSRWGLPRAPALPPPRRLLLLRDPAAAPECRSASSRAEGLSQTPCQARTPTRRGDITGAHRHGCGCIPPTRPVASWAVSLRPGPPLRGSSRPLSLTSGPVADYFSS